MKNCSLVMFLFLALITDTVIVQVPKVSHTKPWRAMAKVSPVGRNL